VTKYLPKFAGCLRRLLEIEYDLFPAAELNFHLGTNRTFVKLYLLQINNREIDYFKVQIKPFTFKLEKAPMSIFQKSIKPCNSIIRTWCSPNA
jgi:hypothetical protein